MNKFMKKSMAAVLAMALVGGAVPTAVAGTNLLKPSVTAEAAGETKEIAVGTTYYIGDIIDFVVIVDVGCDVYNDDKDDNSTEVAYGKSASGITVSGYDSVTDQYKIENVGHTELYLTAADWDTEHDIANIAGIKCASGSGSPSDPYKFELVYQNATVPTAEISAVSLTLDDSLGLNFYVDNVDITNASDYSVKFTGECEENGLTVPLTEKNGKYCATANVPAHKTNEYITAELYNGDEKIDETVYNVEYYLFKLMDTGTAKEVKLADAISVYITAARNYFNDAGFNMNYAFGDGKDYAITAADVAAYAPSFTSDEAKVSAVLNSKTALRLYSDNGTETSKYGKYTEVAGLTPLELGQPHTIDGYEVSGYTWVYRVLNNPASDQKTTEMAKGLYAYMKAAEEYAAEPVTSTFTLYPFDGSSTVYSLAKEFTYTEGMTWKEFVEQSTYANFTIGASDYVRYDGEIITTELDGGDVSSEDEISESVYYYSYHIGD